jgi:pimeloyl-ACP methyl ester carboxylesterase
MRQRIKTPHGITVSYSRYGSGSPLVLVHGGFSDDITNWEFVKPILEKQFTVWAIARRGRGETDATAGHSLEEEAQDVVALVESIEQPVFLLGHSYGAQCSLAAAARLPGRVRKLILYEPPSPELLSAASLQKLEALASKGAWDEFTFRFFNETLLVPKSDLEQLRASELWAPTVGDAPATLEDLRALSRYNFSPARFQTLTCPVLLQVGSESPPQLYATKALEKALPNVRIETLAGQAHEGMTTAPEMYAESVSRFLLT